MADRRINFQNRALTTSIALVRALQGVAGDFALVQGYYAQGDGADGTFYFDPADTTSADNGSTIIVAGDGGRWKLLIPPVLTFKMFGAKGDGTTDDTTALTAAYAFAGALTSLSNANLGPQIVIEGSGKDYAHSGAISLSTMKNVRVQNACFIALTGGALSATVPMLRIGANAVGNVFQDCTWWGSKFAAGVSIAGGRTQLYNPTVYNFKGYGVFVDNTGSGDQRIEGGTVFEYNSGDAEFASDASFTADGIFIDRADCIVGGGLISKWAKRNIRFGSNAATCLVSDAHFYNGGSGVVLRLQPTTILVEAGASNISFDNCYIDNGSVDLFSPAVSFSACKALWSSLRATLTYWIGLYANGQNGPYQFHSSGWQIASTALTDGTIPFIALINNSPNAWSGNYSNFVNAPFYKELANSYWWGKSQTDSDPILTLFAPSGMYPGVQLNLADAATTQTDTTLAPGLHSSGNYLVLKNQRRTTLSVTDGDYTLLSTDSGKALDCFTTTVGSTVKVPSDAELGWFADITQQGPNTVTLAFTGSGTFFHLGGSAPWITTGQFASVRARVVSNASGSNPNVMLVGDIG